MHAVQTNVIGSYNGSIVALRAFLPEGRGKLINIPSAAAQDGKPTMQNGYAAATKAWERSLQRRWPTNTRTPVSAYSPSTRA